MKKIIALILSLALSLLSLTSCLTLGLPLTLFGIQYANEVNNPYNKAKDSDIALNRLNECYGLSEEGKTKEIVYIPDNYADEPITVIGGLGGLYTESQAYFFSDNLKKIYIPWSIERLTHSASYGSHNNDNQIKVISASTHVVPITSYLDLYPTPFLCAIPLLLYNDIFEDGCIGTSGEPDAHKIDSLDLERCLPANISYFFNYGGAPNQGYFFVDLLEETGKLTKPPYDPKREGYTFAGWYRDKECEVPFNFEEDSIEISFDIEGNRIYEEFCLYAKWVAE